MEGQEGAGTRQIPRDEKGKGKEGKREGENGRRELIWRGDGQKATAEHNRATGKVQLEWRVVAAVFMTLRPFFPELLDAFFLLIFITFFPILSRQLGIGTHRALDHADVVLTEASRFARGIHFDVLGCQQGAELTGPTAGVLGANSSATKGMDRGNASSILRAANSGTETKEND
ncbi:uncharacterized protein SPSK_09921 [Sporothrix schenckii 1099-18]|uniref:Uncharacterized protein n=1 Tax=Sporothrix schenckii 1099-18 TaxID=1397361 RepID=A0A0F2MA63_SPOSC|nr:uncharacterized protein SPSK_09921 [Sporothrix schenckii 1099-18]KJR85051.1 hypothetical protein SPSK_09921 [Sporothrix schenckii 1099-18]